MVGGLSDPLPGPAGVGEGKGGLVGGGSAGGVPVGLGSGVVGGPSDNLPGPGRVSVIILLLSICLVSRKLYYCKYIPPNIKMQEFIIITISYLLQLKRLDYFFKYFPKPK